MSGPGIRSSFDGNLTYCALALIAVFNLLVGANAQSQSATALTPSYEPYANAMHHGVPAWSPGDRDILYATIHPYRQAGHVYRVPSSGGRSMRLFPDDKWSASPAWSPDGNRIAFACEVPDGRHICTSRVDGTDLRQVTRGVFGVDLVPSWSPDGKFIAYGSVSREPFAVMLAGSDGSSASRFADGVRPRFSPDGKQIAYAALVQGKEAAAVWAVYVKEVAGGEPRLLAGSKGVFRGWPSGADWSPDGRQIVFVRHLGGPAGDGSELILVDVGNDRVVRAISLEGTLHDPAWSHDGKRIAYMLQTPDRPGEIHTVNLNDGKTLRITEQRQLGSHRLVRYPSAGGMEIPAYLFEPAVGAGKQRAALIWVHGGEPGAGFIQGTYDPSIQYFVDQGFTVLAPNYRGSIGWSDKLAQVESGMEIIGDIEAGARFLLGKGLVDPGRIGLVGFSFGGCLSLLTAGRYPGLFSAVVDFSGPTDLAALYRESNANRAVMVRLLGGTPEEKPGAYRAFSPVSYTDRIKSPVLIFHGTADKTISYAHSTAIAEALKTAGGNVRLVTLRSGHGYSPEDNLKVYPEAAAFLSTHLQSGG